MRALVVNPTVVYSNVAYSVQRAAINASAGGLNTIIAGSAGVKIVVLQYKRIAAGAVTATWESSGGTVLDGPCALAANGGESAPYSSVGHFETLSGEGLSLLLGSGVQVGGSLSYIQVPA